MELEFSFNGVSCTEMGLTYVPSRKNVTPNLTDITVVDATPTYRHGGYYFGYQVKPKEFILECFAEEINRQKYEDILLWLTPGTEGELSFNDRPLVYYDVVVTGIPEAEAYWDGQSPWSTFSAKMTFKMTAYNPFGILSAYFADESEEAQRAKEYSGLLDSDLMPSHTITEAGTYLFYNPGNYESDTILNIAGTASNGITIRNLTNGDVCTLTELPEDPEYLQINSTLGTVHELPAFPDALAYAYHDEGYIRLAPGLPRRNIRFLKHNNDPGFQNNEITTESILTKSDEGRYVYLGGKWVRIAHIKDSHTAVVSESMLVTGLETTTMVTMNEIQISGNSITLSEFELECIPLVR